jgi:hypothetical protein
MTSEWDWFRETNLEIGGSLMFARGAVPERVMAAFAMNPANAQLVPWSQAERSMPYADWLETHPPDHPWIRVGTAGDWGFAIDESSGGWGGYEEDAARELSVGTDVVWVNFNMSLDSFRYYADSAEVTSFEPLAAWERSGTEPDRFLPAMRRAALRVDSHEEADFRDPRAAVLEMLTLALGIRLQRDVALGPLLTVQRD